LSFAFFGEHFVRYFSHVPSGQVAFAFLTDRQTILSVAAFLKHGHDRVALTALGCHLVIRNFFDLVNSQLSPPKFVTFDNLSLYTKSLLNWIIFRGGPVALNG